MADGEPSELAWSARDFETTEEEIKFYQSEIETLHAEGACKSTLSEALLNLGTAFSAADRYNEAEETLLEVRTELETIWGWDHQFSLACITALGQVFEALGKQADAYRLYETAIAGVHHALGSEYPWTTGLMNNYACLCARYSDFDSAKALFSKAYEAKRHVFGQDHRTTLDALCNLHRFAPPEKQDNYEDAMSSSLERLREKYGNGNMIVIKASTHLAAFKFRTGKSEDAQALCKAAGVERKCNPSLP